MARLTDNNFSENIGLTDNSDQITINAMGKDTIEVPNSDFIADSNMVRDGQDLILETSDGQSIVVQDYFLATPAPSIEAPNGSTLSPSLVNSFAQSSPEYAQNSTMTDESPVGAVEEVTGQATVQHANGTSSIVSLGMPIYEGDIIETSETGAVNILFTDETSMAVSENARMSIDEYEFNANDESGVTNLSVLRGVFVYTSGLIGREDPDDVKIETPVGSIGIRGTIIAGRINPDGESDVTVIEGAIVVSNAIGETTLSEQFETVKLTGLNSSIKNIGTLEAGNMNDVYGSASSVIPQLFSSINDAADEAQKAENKVEAEEAKEETKLELEAEEEVEEQVEEQVEAEAESKEILLQLDPSTATENPLKDGSAREKMQINNGNGQSENSTHHAGYAGSRSSGQDLQNPDTIVARPQLVGQGPNISTIELGDINNDGFNDTLRFNILDPSNVGLEQNRAVKISYGGGNGSFTMNAPTGSLAFGEEVAAIGDYNSDGITDFAVMDPDRITGAGALRGHLYIYSGDDLTNPIATLTNTNPVIGGTDLSSIGDVNGDGHSDVFYLNNQIIAGDSHYEAYVVWGNDIGNAIQNVTFQSSERFVQNLFDSNAGIGDFNGDGIDDYAISTTDGTVVNTHIIHGGTHINGDIVTLDPALADYTHVIPAGKNASDFRILDTGDVYNDGDDDFSWGFGNGQTPQVGIGSENVVANVATSTNRSIVSHSNLSDGGESDVSLRGLSNTYQEYEISNSDFRSIDGGNGNDAIRITQALDFRNINFEQIEQIETIELNGNDLTLNLENILNFMKSSDTKNLVIKGLHAPGDGIGGSTLQIEGLGSYAGLTLYDQLEEALRISSNNTATAERDAGGNIADSGIDIPDVIDVDPGQNGYIKFSIGDVDQGYGLYLDTDLTLAAV